MPVDRGPTARVSRDPAAGRRRRRHRGAAALPRRPVGYAVVGTGLCGALTTFSTFGYETVRLALEGSRAAALLNVAVNLVGAYAACAFGWWVGGLA